MRIKEQITLDGVEFFETADGCRTIRNVTLLGAVSKNGRTYAESAMRGAVEKGHYQGVRVFLNHAENASSRNLMDLAGQVENARYETGRIKGDVRLLPDPVGQKVWDVAKLMPQTAGFSHVADGRLVVRDGKQIIEEITRVFSVDCVVNPATTRGIFEGQDDALVVRAGESQVTFSTRAFREIRQQHPCLSDTAIWKQIIEAWDAHDEVPAAEQTPQSQTVPQTTPAEAPAERTPQVDTLTEKLEAYDKLKAEIVDLASGSRDRQQIVIDHQRQLAEEDRQRQRQQRQEDARKLEEIMAKCDRMIEAGGRETDEEFAQRLRERRELREQREKDAARIAEQSLQGGALRESR